MRYDEYDYDYEYSAGNEAYPNAEVRRPQRVGRGMEFSNSWQSNRGESSYQGTSRGRGRASSGFNNMSLFPRPSRGMGQSLEFSNMDMHMSENEMSAPRSFRGKMYKMPSKGLLDQPMGGYEEHGSYLLSQPQHPSLLSDPMLDWSADEMGNDYSSFSGRGGHLALKNRLQYSSKRGLEEPFAPESLMSKRIKLSGLPRGLSRPPRGMGGPPRGMGGPPRGMGGPLRGMGGPPRGFNGPPRGIRGRGRGRVLSSSVSRPTNESQSSAEMTTNEEKPGAEGTNKKPEIPVEALFCHFCNLGNFTSDKMYRDHLQGMDHKNIAMSVYEKNEAHLEYLRKKAMLFRLRSGDAENKFIQKVCDVCLVPVSGRFKEHKQNLEHTLVRNFLRPSCCDRSFKTRHDMEEHRLSLPHLKKVYLEKIRKQELESKEEINSSFKEAVDQLKQKSDPDLEVLTLENMPTFDGNSIIGINYIEAKEAAFCKICKIAVAFESLEAHLKSLIHFTTIQEQLTQQTKELGQGKEDVAQVDSKDEPTVEDESESPQKNYRNTKLKRERGDNDTDDEDSEDELLRLAEEEVHQESEGEEDDLPPIEEENFELLEENGDAEKISSKDVSEPSQPEDNDDSETKEEETEG